MKCVTQYLAMVGVLFIPYSISQADLLPASMMFSQMDRNEDGKINRKEINKQSLLAQEFDKVDRNQDGNLDKKEFEYFIVSIDL